MEEKEKKVTVESVLGVGISLALLFGLTWVISKAWKKGQKA